jgi:heme/copper-type cytochrome/quinol oxidase subunit 3
MAPASKGTRVAADLSELPTSGFGPRSIMWWGTLCFIGIETAGFLLAIAAYLLLADRAPAWPPSLPLPALFPGTLLTALLIVSAVPNAFAVRAAKAHRVSSVRLGMVLLCVFSILPVIVRCFEFAALNVRWDDQAYGSIVWTLLGLHTVHLVTDVIDTLVLTALMFTKHGHLGRRLSDVEDNSFYWNFVIVSWLPIYFIIYWFPRLV